MAAILTIPALAVTEAEVEAQVAAEGKAAVAGNVLIWFLCAVAFSEGVAKNRQLYFQPWYQCGANRRLHAG